MHEKKYSRTQMSGSEEEEDDEEPYASASTSAHVYKKSTRQIQIGWLHSEDGGTYIQIKTKNGGGTRNIAVPKMADKNYILQKGKEIFFRDGKSSKGEENYFDFNLFDYSQCPITEEITVEEMYKTTGFTRLRFYVATTRKTFINEESEESDNDRDNTAQAEVHTASSIITVHDLSQGLEFSHNSNNTDNSYVNLVQNIINNEESIATTLSFNQSQNDDLANSKSFLQIQLHRGQMMEELISIYFNIYDISEPIIVEMILPNVQKESARDIGGVFRDALSEFWNSFYDKCTIGTDVMTLFVMILML